MKLLNYKTKPELAVEIIQQLKDFGFKIKLVLADSLYGESGDVIGILTLAEVTVHRRDS
jgi:SRSO17 transposase